jgi:hypothetical protein
VVFAFPNSDPDEPERRTIFFNMFRRMYGPAWIKAWQTETGCILPSVVEELIMTFL